MHRALVLRALVRPPEEPAVPAVHLGGVEVDAVRAVLDPVNPADVARLTRVEPAGNTKIECAIGLELTSHPFAPPAQSFALPNQPGYCPVARCSIVAAPQVHQPASKWFLWSGAMSPILGNSQRSAPRVVGRLQTVFTISLERSEIFAVLLSLQGAPPLPAQRT